MLMTCGELIFCFVFVCESSIVFLLIHTSDSTDTAPNVFTVYNQVSTAVWQWLSEHYGLFQMGGDL